jgi:hypothetical protein
LVDEEIRERLAEAIESLSAEARTRGEVEAPV